MATLGEMFTEATKLFNAIESSPADSADKDKQDRIRCCIQKFSDLWRAIDSAKVFSRNEEIDDLPTSDIQFFLVLYYLGDLHERIVDTHRPLNLRNAIRCFQCFMKVCLDYSIITEKEYDALSTPLNPTDRGARIERLKKQKELQSSLAELAEKKKQISRGINDRPGKPDVASNAGVTEQEAEYDSVVRRYWLLSVQDRLNAASQQLHMSTREVEMLDSLTAEQKENAARSYQEAIKDSRGKAPDKSAMTRIESAPVPLIFTQLPMDREKILSEVFMDRNPPTMSDGEYARIQMERMQVNSQPEQEESEDSENEEVADRKTKKASKWDDWKDDHARDGNMGANIG